MYDELIEELRRPHADCNPWALMEQAADAIEGLQKQVEDYECRLEISPEAEYAIDKHCNDIISRMDKLIKGLDDKPRWIPVTERLPDCFYGEEIGNVEWISHGTVYAGCFGRGGRLRDAYFRVWNDDTEGIDAKDAEYWRFVLLPEPPKEET